MSNALTKVLETFQNRLTYRELDSKALDISRAAAAGNLGSGDYADWAMVSDDPLVMVNYVKTFITSLASKLSASPFQPESDVLAEAGVHLRLNSLFTEVYTDVLADGYAYVGIGISDGVPQVKQIDARYILFNGDDPTLKDSTGIIVFEISPKDDDDKAKYARFPQGYVEFDESNEKVTTSHYHKDSSTGGYVLDVYTGYDEEPERYELGELDRIPIVRFVGEKVELSDKRFHYRGLYHQTASILKAMTLAATKIQIRTAASDDDNYIVQQDAIANHMHSWANCGVKTCDNKDANGEQIDMPMPIPHDNVFLVNAFQTWKSVISDLLGPVVASSSEAVTREEVIARNEVRDAITNSYMAKVSDSVSEVYRCIQMLTSGDTSKVIVLGGFLDAAKRSKHNAELGLIYNYAKEAGLNTQGFVGEFLNAAELPSDVKDRIGQTLATDPFASPKVLQLTNTIQQMKVAAERQDQQMVLLRVQAAQRLERQAEFVAMQERVKRSDLAFKQWQQEQKDTQQGRMEILKAALKDGNIQAAMQVLSAIEAEDSLVTSQPDVVENIGSFDNDYAVSVQTQLNETADNVPQNQGVL